MRSIRFVLLVLSVPFSLVGCATSDAYRRMGTTTVRVREVIVTSDDGRTQTKDITTTTYQSPALDALKSVGGVAAKAAR